MTESKYFVRAQGRITGPFDLAQLESMRSRGLVARFHEISTDRSTWSKAGDLIELFPAPSQEPAPLLATPSPPSAQDDPSWYIMRGDTPSGPVSAKSLHRMAFAAEIGPETLVWRQGMAAWTPCREVDDLSPTLALIPPHKSESLEFSIRPDDRNQRANPQAQSANPAIQPSQTDHGRTSGLAIASLVLGLLWLCGLGSLLATIFGSISLTQISRSKGALGGKGMAIAGLILGVIGLSFWAVALFVPNMYIAFARALNAPNRFN